MPGTGRGVRQLPRKRVALALTVSVHLIGVLAWMQGPHVRSQPQPEMVWMVLRPIAHFTRRDIRPAPPPATPRRDRPAAEAGTALPKPAGRHPPPPPASVNVPAATHAADMPQPAAPLESGDAGDAGTPAGPRFDLDLARRQARRGANDGPRESRLQAEPDTRWARLARELDAAHVAPATGVQQDSYTAPDGTIIYRKRVGKRFYCRRSGDVTGSDIPGAGGGGNAGSIACPSQAEWKPLP